MAAAAIPSIISLLTGGGTPSTVGSAGQTTTQNAGTQTQQKLLTPDQAALSPSLFAYVKQLMDNPTAAVAPIDAAARSQVNKNYAGASDTLRQKFLATGGGNSGKYGLALADSENHRLDDLSQADIQSAMQALGLQSNAAGLGANLLAQNDGSTSTGTSTGVSDSTTVPVVNSSSLQQVLNALRGAGINVGDPGMGGEEID